ncbi:MAG: hypothetical protein JW791_02630 [Nanoarchaeota archaeon]|nr:hypothetical protein [Nanoarchaeota archaeon]
MPSMFILGKTSIELNNVIFNYADFYRFMKKTLEERGYFIEEKKYSHAPTGDKSYVDFYWKCLKNIDDYSRFIIEVDTKFSNVEPITVLVNKVKQTKDKGDGSIKLRASLSTDYDTKWEENPIINFVKTIFENIFEKSSVNQYKKDLKNELYELENEVKSYFNVQRMI